MIKPYKDLSPAGKLIRKNILSIIVLVTSFPMLLWGYAKVKRIYKAVGKDRGQRQGIPGSRLFL